VCWHGTHARLTVHSATACALLPTPRRPCLNGARGGCPPHTGVRERTGCSWRLYASTFHAKRKLAPRLHRMLFTQKEFADRGGWGSPRGGVQRRGALTTCWLGDTTSSQRVAREAERRRKYGGARLPLARRVPTASHAPTTASGMGWPTWWKTSTPAALDLWHMVCTLTGVNRRRPIGIGAKPEARRLRNITSFEKEKKLWYGRLERPWLCR